MSDQEDRERQEAVEELTLIASRWPAGKPNTHGIHRFLAPLIAAKRERDRCREELVQISMYAAEGGIGGNDVLDQVKAVIGQGAEHAD